MNIINKSKWDKECIVCGRPKEFKAWIKKGIIVKTVCCSRKCSMIYARIAQYLYGNRERYKTG